jgi:hypothetical protein
LPKVVDFTDREGYKRRVLMPDDSIDDDPHTGIPISVDLSELVPLISTAEISNRLFERGLIQSADYDKPGADNIIIEVLRNLYRLDVAQIKAHVRQQKG